MLSSSGIGLGLAALAVALALPLASPAAATGPIPAMAPVGEGLELIMVEQPGCWYCARWKAEVMPGYARTAEGRAAPLRMVTLDGPWPDGLILGSRPAITPTFILIRGGAELSRLEGYPGEAFFWPLLAGMLAGAGIGLPPAGSGG